MYKQMISKILFGHSYNVFTDDDLEDVWAAGANPVGQCGLTKDFKQFKSNTWIICFKQNGMRINKLFVTAYGSATFFYIPKKPITCTW